MTSEEYLYILALKQCKNIGNINLKKLIANIGSATGLCGNMIPVCQHRLVFVSEGLQNNCARDF